MKLKNIINEDFTNYKKPSMTIIFPYCTFKCGVEVCQNSALAQEPNIEIDIDDIVTRYINNPITEAIVMQGLEPIDSWEDLQDLVIKLRVKTEDDIVIYTGYNKEEIQEELHWLKCFSNIVVKFGRFYPNQKSYQDSVLGVRLASQNQYAERIS